MGRGALHTPKTSTTPKPPFDISQVPSDRDHEAPVGATWGTVGMSPNFLGGTLCYVTDGTRTLAIIGAVLQALQQVTRKAESNLDHHSNTDSPKSRSWEVTGHTRTLILSTSKQEVTRSWAVPRSSDKRSTQC